LVSYSPIISKEEKKRFRITGEVVTPIDPPPGCRFASRCPMAKDICKKEEPVLKEIGKNRKAACHFV
jgi:peptide/nickel transport system ATP-binding protein